MSFGSTTSLLYLVLIVVISVYAYVLRRRETGMADLLEKLDRERRAVLNFMNKLGERLTAVDLAVDPTLKIITDFVTDATEAESGAAYLIDDEKNLSARVVLGMFPNMLPSQTGSSNPNILLTKQKYVAERVKRERIPLGVGIIGEAAQKGQPILVADASKDPRIPQNRYDVLSVRSIIAAPLQIRGKILGVLAAVNKRDGRAFTQEDLDLLVAVADQAASTVELVQLYNDRTERQRIEQELKVAHEFQQMLLPSSYPEVPGMEISAFSAPAQEVGGDYYDLFFVDEGRRYLGVVVADVSGKGIPGALVMSVVRCTMRAIAPGNLSPRDVLIRANERVFADTKDNVFVTITYGIFDTVRNTFCFCRAGHEPTVILGPESRAGAIKLSSPPGIAMGLISSDIFSMIEEEELKLKPGDCLLLYTDGVVEAMNAHQDEYGQARFHETLVKHRNDHPNILIENLLADIEKFTKGYPQHDDITVVALRSVGSEASTSALISHQAQAEG
jgi:sigma-B regulation protein RsbU (phosphoserine phosphatase)